MEIAKISSKGQITIPISIRNKLNLKTGDKIVILEENGRFYFENSAMLAFRRAEDAFAGEAEKAGFSMKRRVLSMLVDNTSGVLSRVSGLFSRRGYNIDSLTVGETADPRYSRMTVVVRGDELILDQITKQLAKLIDVVDIKTLQDGESVTRELILVKVRADAEHRQDIVSTAGIFRANIVDVGVDSLTIEMTGNQSKIEAFIGLLMGYEILELARTGITGLSRGADDVRYL